MELKIVLGCVLQCLLCYYNKEANAVAIAQPIVGFNSTKNLHTLSNSIRARRQDDPEDNDQDGETSKPEKPKDVSVAPSKNVSIIKLDKSKASFVEAVVLCLPKADKCMLSEIGDLCPLACILDPFPLVKNKIFIVAQIVQTLCLPVASIYDRDLGIMSDFDGGMKRYSQFAFLAGQAQNVGRFARLGAQALPFQMIKYGKNPVLDMLKPVTASVTISMNTLPIAWEPDSFNPHCETADLWAPSLALMEVFVQNPLAVDLALPGWFVAMNMFNMDLGRLDPFVTALRKVLKLFTGVECALVQYSESGEATDCKFALGPIKPFPLPIINEQETLCGVLPDIPAIDLHKMFPNLFPVDEMNNMKNNFDNIEGVPFR